ncbi:MAG: DUF1963 domain-containing protein [Hyphomicrobiales bacterium]
MHRLAALLGKSAVLAAFGWAAIAVAVTFKISILLLLLIILLTFHYSSRAMRKLTPRLYDAIELRLTGRQSRIGSLKYNLRVAEERTRRQSENLAAKQPALDEFARAHQNLKPGIALIRPYPPPQELKVRSRIGGLPDLPETLAWPRVEPNSDRRLMRGGCPLHFLAQLDLHEMPIVDPRLPAVGTLFFFAHFDEELGWSGTRNSVRVLFDPKSKGRKVCPPPTITPICDGTSEYQCKFGIENDSIHAIFPEWPLLARTIETVPGPQFSRSDKLYSALMRRRTALEREFLISQLAGKVNTQFTAKVFNPYEFGWIARDSNDGKMYPTKLASEELFCHPRLCELLTRRLINMFKRAEPDTEQLIVAGKTLMRDFHAEKVVPLETRGRLQSWVSDVVRVYTWRMDFPGARISLDDALKSSLLQFVAESGKLGLNTRHIHEKIFAFAAAGHVLQRSDWGMYSSDDDESIAFFHQSLGHIWTAQGLPKEDAENICLLNLKSDFGLGMLICDAGDMQFWITPKDLAAKNFSNVWATTQGH